uniref:Uncharacterized protein n=1 Tax=uncultured marine group II/III euryarchaeote AD1000_88_D12 TaxID=1457821 RepID=A0A075G4Z2_9EURY|nr:hypothetical protein [uncultured marine group II/III euryarchaeote AD1000_88_D12]
MPTDIVSPALDIPCVSDGTGVIFACRHGNNIDVGAQIDLYRRYTISRRVIPDLTVMIATPAPQTRIDEDSTRVILALVDNHWLRAQTDISSAKCCVTKSQLTVIIRTSAVHRIITQNRTLSCS